VGKYKIYLYSGLKKLANGSFLFLFLKLIQMSFTFAYNIRILSRILFFIRVTVSEVQCITTNVL